jgi:hypothetical protein
MIVIGNPMVIRDLILHPQEDQCGTGDTHPQPCDIEDAEPLILPEIPDRGRQIITEHMACVSRYPANPMPVLQPARFQPLIESALLRDVRFRNKHCPLSKKSLFYIR